MSQILTVDLHLVILTKWTNAEVFIRTNFASYCVALLLFDIFSLGLLNAFLNSSRCTFYHFLGFFETQTCNTTNCLDNSNLVVSEPGHNNIKFALLFCSSTSVCICRSSASSRIASSTAATSAMPLEK